MFPFGDDDVANQMFYVGVGLIVGGLLSSCTHSIDQRRGYNTNSLAEELEVRDVFEECKVMCDPLAVRMLTPGVCECAVYHDNHYEDEEWAACH
jgi:hypothetical protein